MDNSICPVVIDILSFGQKKLTTLYYRICNNVYIESKSYAILFSNKYMLMYVVILVSLLKFPPFKVNFEWLFPLTQKLELIFWKTI